jgi:hypothetical protein
MPLLSSGVPGEGEEAEGGILPKEIAKWAELDGGSD